MEESKDCTTPPEKRTGKICRIVFSGGPGAGKSTAVRELPQLLKGDPDSPLQDPIILTVEESATAIWKMGVKRSELTNGERALAFQEAVFDVQCQMEDSAVRLARKMAPCSEDRTRDIVLLMDRGVMDSKGYVSPRVWEALLLNKNTSEGAILARYDAVIHLRTVAIENPPLYARISETNVFRTESREEAEAQDYVEQLSWGDHPNQKVVMARAGGWDGKMELVKKAVYEAVRTTTRMRPSGPTSDPDIAEREFRAMREAGRTFVEVQEAIREMIRLTEVTSTIYEDNFNELVRRREVASTLSEEKDR